MALWLEIIEKGFKGLKELFEKSKEKKIQSYEAIEAVYEAANQTTLFLQGCMRKIAKCRS
jgi:adenylylsulfate kinase-like enzyme